jgi:hypothetical protein
MRTGRAAADPSWPRAARPQSPPKPRSVGQIRAEGLETHRDIRMTAGRPGGDDPSEPGADLNRRTSELEQPPPPRRNEPAIDAASAKPRRQPRSERKKPPGLY